MDRVEFLQIRSAAAAGLPPASPAVVAAAVSALQRRLTSSVSFAQVEVEATTDPERLVVAMVRHRPGMSERQVASLLEAVWITQLRLPGLDAFHFHTDPGYVELEAVTGDEQSGYFLSLNLIAVEGAAEDFEGSGPVEVPDELPGEVEQPRARRRFWRPSSSGKDAG